MAKGRKREPTAALELKGSRMQNREPEREVKAAIGLPPMPQDLDDIATEEWNTIGPELERTGVIARVETRIFESYCRLVSELALLRTQVAAEGTVFPGVDGKNDYQNPRYRQLCDARLALLRHCVELGLTPSARSNVRVEKAPSEDDWLKEFTASLRRSR